MVRNSARQQRVLRLARERQRAREVAEVLPPEEILGKRRCQTAG